VIRLLLWAVAWRAILQASYPDSRIRYRSILGAYLVGVGINSVAPARAGDVIKLYLVRHRLPESSYATLTPTLVSETLFDFFVAGGLIVWALAIGALPTHQVSSRLPGIDWGFFVKHAQWTGIGLAIVASLLVIALIIYIERGSESRARIARGFAIMHDPSRFVRWVVLPQALSWGFRLGSMYYFLRAFGVHASIHNALLALVVDSLATLFPATPGGAGTKQGLIVFLFAGEAYSKSLLLAFSVGMNIAVVVFNLALGVVALYLMAGTLSWRSLRAAASPEKSQTA